MKKAFVFSLEATLSLVFLAGILLVQIPPVEKDLHGLAVFQKENDLLKIWAKQQKFSLEQMKKDFEFAFPNVSYELAVNEEKIFSGEKTKKAIASEMIFFDSELNKITVSVSVFQ